MNGKEDRDRTLVHRACFESKLSIMPNIGTFDLTSYLGRETLVHRGLNKHAVNEVNLPRNLRQLGDRALFLLQGYLRSNALGSVDI